MAERVEAFHQASLEDQLIKISNKIFMLEMDDTIGHTYNGAYFTELRWLRDERQRLHKLQEHAQD